MQYKSYKIRLEPSNVQSTLLLQHCGVARHAYNVLLRVAVKNIQVKDIVKSTTMNFAEVKKKGEKDL